MGPLDYYEAQPRRAVQGGVVVAKPGKATDPVAMEVVEAAAMETRPKILARRRTYARARQVVEVHTDPRSPRSSRGSEEDTRMKCVSIAQSSQVRPGEPTAPVPTAATTTGANTPRLWHVAAFLLDRDPDVRGSGPSRNPLPASGPSPCPRSSWTPTNPKRCAVRRPRSMPRTAGRR